jgi:ubiquinone/menaquinone biosynthesis C-methylase UbiE
MFDQFCDSAYLKKSQYKNADNLNARITLHQRFSTNTADWQDWVFKKADIQAGHKVLEIGSGPGSFWKPNLHQVPENLNPVLTDLSIGMVKNAKTLQESYPGFHYSNVDSMRLPFKQDSFDRVIANHMLYHVPDIATVLRETARVLKPNGVMVAATNGENHMLETYSLLSHLLPEFFSKPRVLRRFNLDNGESQLRKKFNSVELFLYEDSLKVTESQPLLDYLDSLWGAYFDESIRTTLRNLIKHEIKANGYFFIQKSTGVFIAKNPK